MTCVGCASTVILGQCANFLGAAANPAVYGKLIWLWNIVGYIGSIPCFYIGGKKYKEFVDNQENEAKSKKDKLIAA